MSLPKDTNYTLIDHFHTGGMESADSCDHCGKAITRVGIIQSDQGDKSTVGIDCAATLTSDSFAILEAQAFMQAFEATKRKIKKELKANPAAKIKIHEYGEGQGYFKEGGFLLSFGSKSINHPKRFERMILAL